MRQRQKGFTLIEIVVALAIVGAVMTTITMTITTLLMNYEQPSTQQVLLQQVKSAGYWMPRDINMANDVTLGSSNGFPFTITIPVDQDENNDYTVDYLSESNTLKRRQFDSSRILVVETLIAQYVDTDNTVFENIAEGSYKLTIRVSMGEEAVTASYETRLRLIVQ